MCMPALFSAPSMYPHWAMRTMSSSTTQELSASSGHMGRVRKTQVELLTHSLSGNVDSYSSNLVSVFSFPFSLPFLLFFSWWFIFESLY